MTPRLSRRGACVVVLVVCILATAAADAPQETLHSALQIIHQTSALPTAEPTQAPERTEGLLEDDLGMQTPLCLVCAQAYTVLRQDGEAAKKRQLYSLDSIAFEAIGVTFKLYAAEPDIRLGVDIDGLTALLEIAASEIPSEYRRKLVRTIVIVVSDKPYCLRYDHWTKDMRMSLSPDLSSYFTDIKTLEDVGGCCLSFPNTWERERVIWLPMGAALENDGEMEKFANCAYSYHLYCTATMNLNVRLLHEIIHALSISRTMPSLEAYGFKANHNWELQQIAQGKSGKGLLTAEAFAYDLSKRIVQEYPLTPIFDRLEGDS